MIWNINFQIAALILALIVVFMNYSQKRLNFLQEKVYLNLLLCMVSCIILDILSIFAINYRGVIGDVACEIACKAYLFNIVLVCYISSQFAVSELRYTFQRRYNIASTIPLYVEVIVFLFNHVSIYAEDNKIYTYGFPVYFTYFVCFVYLIASIVVVVVLRDNMTKKRRYAIYFWIGAWMVTAFIQLFNNHLLLVSYAMALAGMYMYCNLENPEYHLDFSTNVFNRKAFTRLMGESLKTKQHKSIVTFKVGDTSVVNEIFGKKAVEDLYIKVAEFADNLHGGVLFRLETDVFSMAFDKSEDAERAIEDLIDRFRDHWIIRDVPIDIVVYVSYLDSIDSFEDEEDLEEVVYYFADESERRASGTVLAINETELLEKQKNIDLQHALEWAIHNDGVDVYYQPIYSIRDGRFCSMEALVRIRDEKGNLLSPVSFIEFAEKNGMILRLGEIIFRKTCEFIAKEKIENYGIDFVEVNLSVVQCMQEDLARMLKSIMSEYMIAPYRINFEITETAAINSKASLNHNMKELLEYGSGFSLDDYGSGYSNLSYVVGLPVNIIKIDKAMVDSYFISEKVRIATDSTIEMIHKLGMKIVVEGVESEEQYLAFKKLDVEYIQGYYFSKPLAPDKLIPFVKEWM